jgi:cyclopropane-fatty-acyl-phospholipid synthase
MFHFSKKVIYKILSSLDRGTLRIKEKSQELIFGEHSDSDIHAEITVHDEKAFNMILKGGVVGAGEAYMKGYWSTPDLTSVIEYFLVNREILDEIDGGVKFIQKALNKILHLRRRNTITGSKKNIIAHYDLSNDFYELWLDKKMMYSSAIFSNSMDTLDEASTHKLRTICEKLNLNEQDHLCEIGTGWGGMAIFAAKNYGCKVTTTTISDEQHDFAKSRIQKEGLTDHITLLKKDYRLMTGDFSKLVSIEMIEAVGHEYLGSFFDKCNELLQPRGRGLIQAITISDKYYERAKHSVDFIQKYIFPGGALASIEVLEKLAQDQAQFELINSESIGFDYAKTLNHWHQRFLSQIDKIKSLGFSNEFINMWRFYLSYCEGGFKQKTIDNYQILFSK